MKPNGSGQRQVRPSRLGPQCAQVSKLSNLRVLSRPAGSPGRRDLQDGGHLHRSELKRNTMKHSAPLDALATLPVLRDHACGWPWSWARPQPVPWPKHPPGTRVQTGRQLLRGPCRDGERGLHHRPPCPRAPQRAANSSGEGEGGLYKRCSPLLTQPASPLPARGGRRPASCRVCVHQAGPSHPPSSPAASCAHQTQLGSVQPPAGCLPRRPVPGPAPRSGSMSEREMDKGFIQAEKPQVAPGVR